jgi:hypothetical protein
MVRMHRGTPSTHAGYSLRCSFRYSQGYSGYSRRVRMHLGTRGTQTGVLRVLTRGGPLHRTCPPGGSYRRTAPAHAPSGRPRLVVAQMWARQSRRRCGPPARCGVYIYLSIYLPIYLSIYLSTCIYIYIYMRASVTTSELAARDFSPKQNAICFLRSSAASPFGYPRVPQVSTPEHPGLSDLYEHPEYPCESTESPCVPRVPHVRIQSTHESNQSTYPELRSSATGRHRLTRMRAQRGGGHSKYSESTG